MSEIKEPEAILVGGDFVLDHHIYEGRRHHYGDGQSPGVRSKQEIGGAGLVHGLLTTRGQGTEPILVGPDWTAHPTARQPECVDDGQQAYAFWRPHPPEAPEGEQFWRVSEAMGFGSWTGAQSPEKWDRASPVPEKPKIIVLSEGGMGFRKNRECWGDLEFESARWIVLKTAAPVSEGCLWKELHGKSEYRRKLVVILSAQELRKSFAHISSGLSWEATLESLLRELHESPDLRPLTECRHLLVEFGSEGGAWIDFQPSSADGEPERKGCLVHFLYDAGSIEGDHAHATSGSAFGYLSCLAASVVRQLTLDLEKPDLAAAIDGGVSAARDLRERGHGRVSEPPDGFPVARLAGVIKDPSRRLSRAVFPCSAPERPEPAAEPNESSAAPWSLVVDSQPGPGADPGPAYDLARLVLLRGPIALANLPHLRVGGLLATDRQEVESLRTLARLIRHYQVHDQGKIPLSIGSFGPPGAGKSFAVKQLAARLVGEGTWLEFNLSQFNTPDDLIGAFHQVRDRVLQKQLPVAFFDEFDSQEYRWLQYLLAPMQDGKFQEGQITHTLGKCIFVFAGATSWTYETFGPPEPGKGATPEDRRAHRHFVLAKGPDFKSRLDGYLNVTGPNRRKRLLAPHEKPPSEGEGRRERKVESVSGHRFVEDLGDTAFPIRRALMIRAKLRCTPEEQLDIDEGVAHALLRVDRLEHGARSLDKILQPFQPVRPGRLHRSLLPPRGQLRMHCDADEFLRLCAEVRETPRPDPLSKTDVDSIAPVIHATWRVLGRLQGWIEKEDDARFDDLPKSFSLSTKIGLQDLGTFYQESNREAARRMNDLLGLVGLELVSGSWTESEREEEERVRQHLEYHLELLAAEEHHGWMDWHLEQGWKYAPEKKREERLHDCLKPFAELPDFQRNKDRDSVRHFPEFAKEAGKRIAFR